MTGRVVVVELADGIIRSGFAGDHSPRFEINCSNVFQGYVESLEVFRHLFLSVMLLKPKECSVLLIDDTFLRKDQQDVIATVLLRDLQVISLSFQSNLYLAMISSGLVNGLVVYIGLDTAYTFCYSDLRPMLHTMRYCQRADYISAFLLEEIAQHILGSLKSCNHDIRYAVSMGIICCGEGATPDLASKICDIATSLAIDELGDYNLTKLIEKHSGRKLYPIVSPFNCALLSWIGGSIFASLPANNETFIKASQLNNSEDGYLQLQDWMSLNNTTWK